MQLSNEIVLRPRFQIELEIPCSQLLTQFSDAKINQKKYGISCVDHHVYIRLPKEEQLFWSPQLHLEVSEISEDKCILDGFFGPNPTVWTMFIFFHVVVGTLFLADLVWLYSNWSLGNPSGVQIGIGIVLVLVWGLLYMAGSIGKKKGKLGMHALYGFMLETIEVPPRPSQREGKILINKNNRFLFLFSFCNSLFYLQDFAENI